MVAEVKRTRPTSDWFRPVAVSTILLILAEMFIGCYPVVPLLTGAFLVPWEPVGLNGS